MQYSFNQTQLLRQTGRSFVIYLLIILKEIKGPIRTELELLLNSDCIGQMQCKDKKFLVVVQERLQLLLSQRFLGLFCENGFDELEHITHILLKNWIEDLFIYQIHIADAINMLIQRLLVTILITFLCLFESLYGSWNQFQ